MLKCPCRMKRMHCREWRRLPGSRACQDRDCRVAFGTLEHYSNVFEVTPQILLQEVIQGPHTSRCVCLTCYDAGGNRIACNAFRERWHIHGELACS